MKAVSKNKVRCQWGEGDELYEHYHDAEWGVPLYDDDKLFEFLILEGAQAGLSWITILRKRENFREAFDGFDAEKIAGYGVRKKNQLLKNPGIIRNRLKVDSAIKNAKAFLAFREQELGFSEFLWSFVDHKPQQNGFRSMREVPATTDTSEAMSKALKKLGFNFVGGTICYAFMQATGMVNDHVTTCFRHKECKKLASSGSPFC
jgi:DNA-3-methyladenine glycosylase I